MRYIAILLLIVILTACRTGRMSSSAVKQLESIGYKQIYHLNGGMKAWDAAGFPVIEKSWKEELK